MINYKIDVIKELKKMGINTTKARERGIFGQSTMKKFKDGDTNISVDILNRLCYILGMSPGEIIKYTETDIDRKNIAKINMNALENHQNW